ncbi:hypothetical protein AB3N59_11825 [Leptospira sp. WS92.C1]
MKSFFSFYLSVSILFQAILFSSGLFGCILSEKAKICECNHGSKIQKHANKEDSRFSKKAHSNLALSSPQKLPNCHSAKSGEQHACSCKKAENKLSQLSAFYSHLFSSDRHRIPNPISSLIQIVTFQDFNSGIDFSFSLLKPPQIS